MKRKNKEKIVDKVTTERPVIVPWTLSSNTRFGWKGLPKNAIMVKLGRMAGLLACFRIGCKEYE